MISTVTLKLVPVKLADVPGEFAGLGCSIFLVGFVVWIEDVIGAGW